MSLKLKRTVRGFLHASFKDRYGSICSLQESSLAEEAAIWLGVDMGFDGKEGARMHLTQEHVAALLPFLTRFAETGTLE